jgi:hypothetical protein
MRKAEPMRILVAFGALSQVGGEAFEDFRYEPLFDPARLAFACKGIAMAKRQSAGGRCRCSNR